MMQRRNTLKNHIEEIQLTGRRSITILILMIILITFLIIRLGFLQLAKHDLYKTLSTQNWLDLTPVEPTRGLIYDRNGILLAENIPVFSLDVIPNQIKNLPQTLAEIAKIIPLSDDDIAQFHKELKRHRRFDEIPLKLRLTETEVARFYENQFRIPEALIKARLIRHYPFGGMLSHVLGYVGRINTDELEDIDPTNYSATNYIGKLGIEKFYEEELHGTVGYAETENDASGQPVRILKQIKPIPGKNLYLTLDSKLQAAAEQALVGHRGAIVAIQPATGQILALVSEPTYDPNLFVAGLSSQAFQSLQSSPDRPLYNRAVRGLYPPGSTVKPFIALEGLNSGVATPNFSIFDPGWYRLPGSKHQFHDHKRRGHGTVNLNLAIIASCDTYFYDLAHKMGIKRIDNILDQFGFGQLTGVDLDEEVKGLVASPAWKRRTKGVPWYEGDTIISVIGQGFMQVTPLQLAQGVATIANRGKHFTPHLVHIEQEPGKLPEEQPSIPLDVVQLNDPATWQFVINAMQSVITSPAGTGYRFGKDAPYTVAAKTGTAQVYSIKHRDRNENPVPQDELPENLRDHSLFIGFAPINDPQIAIAVIVENSSTASIIARSLMDYYFLKSNHPIPNSETT